MRADIVIIGAGPAGLSLAGVLARKGLKIAIIDPASASDLEQPQDDGRYLVFVPKRDRWEIAIWSKRLYWSIDGVALNPACWCPLPAQVKT